MHVYLGGILSLFFIFYFATFNHCDDKLELRTQSLMCSTTIHIPWRHSAKKQLMKIVTKWNHADTAWYDEFKPNPHIHLAIASSAASTPTHTHTHVPTFIHIHILASVCTINTSTSKTAKPNPAQWELTRYSFKQIKTTLD